MADGSGEGDEETRGVMYLSDDQVRTFREVLNASTIFFDDFDRWMIMLEQGYVPPPERVAILRGAATALREGLATVAQIVERKGGA